MENDPVNKPNEEEYQFLDSDQSAGFSPPSSTRPSMSVKETDGSGRKKAFVIVGIIAAVFCLYKLYGVFSAAPEKPKSEMPAPVETVMQKPVQPAPVVAPTETPKPADTLVSQEVSTVADKVATLERVVSQVSQSNANLQDQMAGVSTTIAEIRNNVSSLSDQMATLAKEKEKPIEVAKPEVKKVIKPKVESKMKAESKTESKMTPKAAPVVKRSIYYVKAMIQGRAWLMTSEGATLTVAEGDNLSGYGQITNIDPKTGEIMTSSGTVIGYRADDR